MTQTSYQRKWYAKNKEKVKAERKRFYSKNKNRINKEYSTIEGFMKTLCYKTRHSSKKRKLPFDLDPDLLLEKWNEQNGLCALSKFPMTHCRGKGELNYNASVDRINNHKGYTKGNTHLVCRAVNRMKSDFSLEEFMALCKGIIKNEI